MDHKSLILLLMTITTCGCAAVSRENRELTDTTVVSEPVAVEVSTKSPATKTMASAPFADLNDELSESCIRHVGFEDDTPTLDLSPLDTVSDGPISLERVLASVRQSYPLLQAAWLSRNIAQGNHLAAHGAFDTKLKGASENGAFGRYQTYRQNLGFDQPTMWGGSVFGGYRIGRGSFQPWYQERLTDDSGEFKAGVQIPLLRNTDIDQRRADLWKTSLGRQLAEPEIARLQIDFLRDASFVYWEWVATGRRVQIADGLLSLARDRNDAIRRRVELGDTDPPVLLDNQRLIVSREAKLIDEQRKLRQTAVKLSLFLRDAQGQPLTAEPDQIPDLPQPANIDTDREIQDIQQALAQRPEFAALDFQRRQLNIDYQQACNETLPDLRAAMLGAKDVGEHASKKRDKRPFELEASLYLDVPLQRRKARGKMMAVAGKRAQLAAKRRMVVDKVTSEVQFAFAGLQAALKKVDRAHEAVQLATQMAEIERRRFELGESDLLAVNLREQQMAEARNLEVDARLEFFLSLAERDAAVGANSTLTAEPVTAPE